MLNMKLVYCCVLVVGWSEDSGRHILRVLELERDAAGSLGLSIAGGIGSPISDTPIIVAYMNPDGPAARSGSLKVRLTSICMTYHYKIDYTQIH